MEQTLTHPSQPNDTIFAIATPAGTGGVAMMRISGPEAFRVVQRIWKGTPITSMTSHTAHLGSIIDTDDSSILDQAVATTFHSPHSYTGENVVELSVHGSAYVQRRLLRLLADAGARLAQPGEFTRRAFTAGKLTITQAEAVADIIASSSKAAHRIASSQFTGKTHDRLTSLRNDLLHLASLLELELDFSEEDVEFADRTQLAATATAIEAEIRRLHNSFATGSAIKQGIPVAISGATNAGKSSLLNALLDDDRAIVSDIHGTTRDTIEETREIGDYLFRFIDTAGLRPTDDSIERLGIERSRKAIASARIVIHLTEATKATPEVLRDTLGHIRSLMQPQGILIPLISKTDLTDKERMQHLKAALPGITGISTLTGYGIDRLKETLSARIAETDTTDEIIITNERHKAALKSALDAVGHVSRGIADGLETDLIAIDLRRTIHHLSQLTGDITTPDILTDIFSHFCIGK